MTKKKSCNNGDAEGFFNKLSNKEKYKLIEKAGLSGFDKNTDFDYSNLLRSEKSKVCKFLR